MMKNGEQTINSLETNHKNANFFCFLFLSPFISFSFFFFTYIFFCSAVEQPDVVFSVEQVRCDQAEPHSPALAPEDCGTADVCDSDPDSEHLATSSQTEDVNPAELFFKLTEEPEELLQLAPEAGEIMLLTGETVQRPKVCDLFIDHQNWEVLLKVSLLEVNFANMLAMTMLKC